jgi:hypothetical protein
MISLLSSCVFTTSISHYGDDLKYVDGIFLHLAALKDYYISTVIAMIPTGFGQKFLSLSHG